MWIHPGVICRLGTMTERAQNRSGILGAIRGLAVLLLCHCSLAHADQNDTRLDSLFSNLKQTSAANEGTAITEKIWEVWYQVPDEETQAMFDRAVVFMAQADYRTSLLAFSRVTQMKPDFAEAWNRRATLLYMMGEFELSIKDIEKTLALEPRHFGAISGLGQIYMRQEKLSLARKAFEKALDINPHLEGARINIRTIDRLMSEKSI